MSFEWNCDEDLFPSDNSWSRQSDPEQPPPPLSLRVFETGETIAAASSRSQTNRIQQSQSRSRTRIDMSGRTTDMTRRKTETTMETTDTSSDEGTEEEKVGICGFFCCICPLPCLRVLLTIMVLGAVFGMGILVGSKIRQGSPNFSSNAEVSNSSSGPFQNGRQSSLFSDCPELTR